MVVQCTRTRDAVKVHSSKSERMTYVGDKRAQPKTMGLGFDIVQVWTWIGLCSVLRPLQHSIGYMGDGFYRSKDPTNSIMVLKENLQKNEANNENN